jgi:hypothetical protein
MKPLKLAFLTILIHCLAFFCRQQSAYAQAVTGEQLIQFAALPNNKIEPALAKKGFTPLGEEQERGVQTNRYTYHPPVKKKKETDSILVLRRLNRTIDSNYCIIEYQTSSFAEFAQLMEDFKSKGFYSRTSTDSTTLKDCLFQWQNFRMLATETHFNDSMNLYSIQLKLQDLPPAESLNFGDDLLAFTSHEYLAYYFGDAHVKKDIYFMSGNDMVRCSILFPNTPRQVVFLWKDERNRTGINSLIFGGQQNIREEGANNGFVAENTWLLKSGIYAGMPIYQLRLKHENSFKFYGGSAANTGMIIPDGTGKINFKQQEVTLGCINCAGTEYARAQTIEADETIADERIVFIFSIGLKSNDAYKNENLTSR